MAVPRVEQDNLAKLDALVQAQLFQGGEVSATDLVQSAIQRIEATHRALNCVVHRAFDHARSAAASAFEESPLWSDRWPTHERREIVLEANDLGVPVQEAQAEVQQLMNRALVYAEQLLRRHGRFYPYGAAMTPDGEIHPIAAHNGQAQPSSEELLERLQAALATGAHRGQYKATARVYDVHIERPDSGEPSDAVAVALDHRSSDSLIAVLPYQIVDGTLTFDRVFLQSGSNDIFATPLH